MMLFLFVSYKGVIQFLGDTYFYFNSIENLKCFPTLGYN